MRVSDIIGHPIVTTAAAEEIARVATPIVDPAQHRVIGFRINDEEMVPLDAVEAIGDEALMVGTPDAVRFPTTNLEQRWVHERLDVVDRLVLSDEGNELAAVEDIEFDPSTGVIEAVVLEDRRLTGDELVGVGAFAVVVQAPTDTPR